MEIHYGIGMDHYNAIARYSANDLEKMTDAERGKFKVGQTRFLRIDQANIETFRFYASKPDFVDKLKELKAEEVPDVFLPYLKALTATEADFSKVIEEGQFFPQIDTPLKTKLIENGLVNKGRKVKIPLFVTARGGVTPAPEPLRDSLNLRVTPNPGLDGEVSSSGIRGMLASFVKSIVTDGDQDRIDAPGIIDSMVKGTDVRTIDADSLAALDEDTLRWLLQPKQREFLFMALTTEKDVYAWALPNLMPLDVNEFKTRHDRLMTEFEKRFQEDAGITNARIIEEFVNYPFVSSTNKTKIQKISSLSVVDTSGTVQERIQYYVTSAFNNEGKVVYKLRIINQPGEVSENREQQKMVSILQEYAAQLNKTDNAMLSGQWNEDFAKVSQTLGLEKASSRFVDDEVDFDALRAVLAAPENKDHPPSVALRTPSGVFDNTVGAPSRDRWLEVLNDTLQNSNFIKIAEQGNVKERQLPARIQPLFAKAKGGTVLSGQELVTLNKALLQAIYPSAIKQTSEDPIDWVASSGEPVSNAYPANKARFNQEFVRKIETILPDITFKNLEQKVGMLVDLFVSGVNAERRNEKNEIVNAGERSYLPADDFEKYVRLNSDEQFSSGVASDEENFLRGKFNDINQQRLFTGEFATLQGLEFEGFVGALRDPDGTQMDAVRKIYGVNSQVGTKLLEIQRMRNEGKFKKAADGSFVDPEASNILAQFKRDMYVYSSLIGFLHNLATSMNRSPASDRAMIADQTEFDNNTFDTQSRPPAKDLLRAAPQDGQLKKYGGIDLNPAQLKIEINKESGGVNVQYDPLLIQRLREEGIDGFVPFIINMQPMTSVMPLLLGEARTEHQMQLTSL